MGLAWHPHYIHMKLNNKYYILRHGEALSNVKSICSSWPEKFKNSLTKKGIKVINTAAEKLKNEKADLIFTSPVLRAQETAKIVAKRLHLTPKSDKRLREIGFGIFNGKPVYQFQSYFKNGAQKIRRRVPGGETYADVARRAFAFFKAIINKKYKGKIIVIISHQAPLLLLMGKIQGKSVKESIVPLNTVFHEKRITKGELIKLN